MQPPPKRSGALTTIAVVALLFGFSGVGCGAAGAMGVVNQGGQIEELRALQANGTSLQPEVTAYMLDMAERGAAWRVPSLISQLVSVALSVPLFLIGWWILHWDPRGLHWGPLVFWIGLGFGIVNMVFAGYIQADMWSEMPAIPLPANSAAAGPAVQGMMDSMMGGMIWVSLCIGGVWTLVKSAVFAWAAVHLRKPKVTAEFRANGSIL